MFSYSFTLPMFLQKLSYDVLSPRVWLSSWQLYCIPEEQHNPPPPQGSSRLNTALRASSWRSAPEVFTHSRVYLCVVFLTIKAGIKVTLYYILNECSRVGCCCEPSPAGSWGRNLRVPRLSWPGSSSGGSNSGLCPLNIRNGEMASKATQRKHAE